MKGANGNALTNQASDDGLAERIWNGQSDYWDALLFEQLSKDLLNAVEKGLKTGRKGKTPTAQTTYNATDGAMITAMETNVFHFSAAKTLAEVQQLNQALRESEGYADFRKKASRITDTFNRRWQQTEYGTAINCAENASAYHRLKSEARVFPYWEYRTAGDDRVREEHAALEGITLPPSDKFWNDYYPPNGWNCRCTAVQVLKDRYPASDSDQACAAGERATTKIGKNGQNKAAMFRFNPGKAGKVFPPKHPYYKAPDEVKKAVKATVTTMMTSNSLPEEIRIRRKEISTEAKETLRSKAFRHPKLDKDISVYGGGIDEWLNQPHKHYAEKNEMLLNIESVIEQSEYLGTTRHRGRNCHVFETELCGEKTWIIVTDVPGRGLSVYSISDGEEILKNIKKPA